MTTILILGAGIMQEPAVRIARRKGWRVILADANPQAPARAMADLFVCIDLKDRDGLLAFARSIQHAGGHRRRRAAARASRAVGRVPGIARRPVEQRLDRCRQAEFGGVGLAADDEARRFSRATNSLSWSSTASRKKRLPKVVGVPA